MHPMHRVHSVLRVHRILVNSQKKLKFTTSQATPCVMVCISSTSAFYFFTCGALAQCSPTHLNTVNTSICFHAYLASVTVHSVSPEEGYQISSIVLHSFVCTYLIILQESTFPSFGPLDPQYHIWIPSLFNRLLTWTIAADIGVIIMRNPFTGELIQQSF